MSTTCEQVTDDLALLVDGDREAIQRHAEHLVSCDACRDARHDATQLVTLVATASSDFRPSADLEARLMAALDRTEKPAAAPAPVPAERAGGLNEYKASPAKPAKSRRPWLAVGAAGALAASVAGVLALGHGTAPGQRPDGTIGTIGTVARAAADRGDGVAVDTGAGWKPLHAHDVVPAGARLKTDERTRTAVDLADGTRLVLDHETVIAFDPAEPRRVKLERGRIVADVVHVDGRPAQVATMQGTIDVIGTRFSVTAADQLTAVQVVRGKVKVSAAGGGHDEVRAGEEGLIDGGKLSVSAAPSLVRDVAWSELPQNAKPDDDATSGLGSLRAYKPGESRDRDWKLALAKHDVKVRIVGPVARTEITETFRNDSDATLEGRYQFPLPADAQIDGLALDVAGKPGAFEDGAFVDKVRAQKIWAGVIDRARPLVQHDPKQEIVWVPGPWRDPALLDWQRGGRFELKVFPIPAHGQRTIKVAYTQIVTPRGESRQYVYPLPHSADGSTVADQMTVDVEVRGAAQGTVRAAGYALAADPARTEVNALTLAQSGFVPRGDLVVDYRASDRDAELRAWTFQGGAAVAPDDKLAAKQGVGIDPKIIDAQRLVAADGRPTAVLALSPKLPRWAQTKPRDYVLVLDGSQSMVGERFARARQLAVAMIDQMDRRDRFTALVCDSDCTGLGDPRAASSHAATELSSWIATRQPAGATDVVASIRAGAAALTKSSDASHERWVLYVGDGFASTGFRRQGDVEKAIADGTVGADIHVMTIGIGSDADTQVLQAAARGGGGSYLAWMPGQTVAMAAAQTLEATYGSALRDAKVELPAGLTDVAPTVLPTVRAGDEVLLAARVTGDVQGDVIVKGTVAGQPFEQHYPLALHVSTAPGNGFVPRLWASLTIDQLERQSADRAKIVALSQGYGVMSRETNLLVLESQAMFDAFGVDRTQPAQKWTGKETLDEATASGTVDVAGEAGGRAPTSDTAKASDGPMPARAAQLPMLGSHVAQAMDDGDDGDDDAPMAEDSVRHEDRPLRKSAPRRHVARAVDDGDDEEDEAQDHPRRKSAPRRHAARAMDRDEAGEGQDPFGGQVGGKGFGRGHVGMVAMRRVWTRQAAIGSYDGVSTSLTREIANATDALAHSPDSREKHRALVQELSYAGELDRARDIAARWLDRDKLDPQALGYIADLLGRDGQRELALRTLDGLVDLSADQVALHERMVNAYERTGRLAQACGHRIAIASINDKDAKAAGAAARCLRNLGRARDADIVMQALADDPLRAAAEKAALVAPVTPRIAGDLVIDGAWMTPADLDISLITPDGTRVSWMGGRSDVVVGDSTSTTREKLAVKTLRRGAYLIEISRADGATAPVRGSLDISVLGEHRALPFELTGTHAIVGRVTVSLTSHLEPFYGPRLNP
jgi:ferric-dicitrate binding protein FerR (iron transport regulator)/tetratricopeptide (TPR) repeat protein